MLCLVLRCNFLMTGGLLPPVNDRRNSEKIISEWLVIRPKYGSWNFFRALVVFFEQNRPFLEVGIGGFRHKLVGFC